MRINEITYPYVCQETLRGNVLAKRLIELFSIKGAAGLLHGDRGRPAPNRLPPELAQRLLALSAQRQRLFNDTHFTEKLSPEEQIRLETIRKSA